MYIKTSTINLLDCFFTAGGHFGHDKTVEKICCQFYWKNMYDDIREFVQHCPKCQQMNARFIKSNAKLHPIPVEPQVWHQVSEMLNRSTLTGPKFCAVITSKSHYRLELTSLDHSQSHQEEISMSSHWLITSASGQRHQLSQTSVQLELHTSFMSSSAGKN